MTNERDKRISPVELSGLLLATHMRASEAQKVCLLLVSSTSAAKTKVRKVLTAFLLLVICFGFYGCESLPSAGTRHTQWPHVIASGEGDWYPEPGYVWTHRDSNGRPIPGNWAVHWKQGVSFSYLGSIKWPHVVASSREDYWLAEPGYTWAHLDSNGRPIPGDFAVVSRPVGSRHPEYEHVVIGSWSPDGPRWEFEEGFEWLTNDPNDFR